MDRVEMGDLMTLNALRTCGLLKFYRTSNMRSQVQLLEMLVRLWDHEIGILDNHGEILELTIEDILFYQVVSSKAPMNLDGISCGGDPLSMQYYFNT